MSDDTTLAELLGTVDLPGTSPFKSTVKRLRQLALVGQVSLLGTVDLPGASPFKSKVERLRQLALVGQVSLLGTLDLS